MKFGSRMSRESLVVDQGRQRDLRVYLYECPGPVVAASHIVLTCNLASKSWNKLGGRLNFTVLMLKIRIRDTINFFSLSRKHNAGVFELV